MSAVGPANIGAYNGAGVPDQSEPVYYDNNYVQAVDWENNVAGSTNGRLWYVGYCYSLVQLQSDPAGLSPGTGSTTGVRLSNNRTSTGNCTAALNLGYLPERHRSTGMRFWMSGDGTARSGYLEFTTASAKYKLNVQIPAEGGWIEADWNGRFYNNTVWKYETVTPQIMRTASSVTIAVNSLPAGEGIYIDDIQWKVDRIDTPDETTSGSGSATTGDSSTTTTAAASNTTTAPTQAPTTAPAPEPGDSVYVRTAVDFDAADGAASTDGGPATVLSKVAAADLQADYAGFGLGSASLRENVRWSNTSDMAEYLAHAGQTGEETRIKKEMTRLSIQDQMEEFMFLGLRKTEGVNASAFERLYGKPLEAVYEEPVERLIREGLLLRYQKEDGSVFFRLSDRGIDVSNYALAMFLF